MHHSSAQADTAAAHSRRHASPRWDLSTLRDRIDVVDRKIIGLIAERLRIVEEVVLAKLDEAP